MVQKLPYSPSVVVPAAAKLVILSGEGGRLGEALVSGGFEAQMEQALRNILEALKKRNLGKAHIAWVFVSVTDMRYEAQFEQIYEKFFEGYNDLPARSWVVCAQHKLGSFIEITTFASTEPLREEPEELLGDKDDGHGLETP